MIDPAFDSPSDPQAWAHEYARRGWRVHPIKPGEKRPPMTAWQDAATTDEATIENWFTQLYRGHGVGVATGRGSGIFVLDVDVSDQKAGDETLADLEDHYGGLPDTPTVTTPSGGVHYYFRLPANVEIRNDAGRRLGHGLDIRGEGGQVVAPPTIRSQGAYEWVGDTYLLEPADAPRWLLDLLTERPEPLVQKNAAPSTDDDSVAARYNSRTSWAGLLTADGWTLGQVMGDGEQRWVRPDKESREGISATVGHGGGDQLTVFTSSIPWLPEGSYSRFGYMACRNHGGDRSMAARSLFEEEMAPVDAWLDELPTVAAKVDLIDELPDLINRPVELAHLVDWGRFWDDDHADEEWLAHPLIPKGRAIALYAPAKAGKSTVVLAVAAAVATGRKILGKAHAEPVDVLYLDYEMTPADLQERLDELGYGPDDDLSRLHYALLPSLPALDTIEGANAIVDLVNATGAQLVVVDTFGRAVEGDEDSADTVRAFYRHTGLTLKSMGITYLRTDHSGKDTSKGQRGSSAKNDDVDLVWKLGRVDRGVKIERTHSRISWVPQEVLIDRVETDYGIDYRIANRLTTWPDGTSEDMEILLRHGITAQTSQRQAREIMAEIMAPRKRIDTAHKMLKETLDLDQFIGSQPRRRGTKNLGAVPRSENLGAVGQKVGAVGAVKGNKEVEGCAVDDEVGAVDRRVVGAPPPYKGGAPTPTLSEPIEDLF